MKFLRVLLVILSALSVQAFALDREAFTFTKYDLDVRVEPEQQRLAVRGKITLRNDSPSAQKNLVLQISSTLDWKSIQIGGKTVQFVTHEYTSDIDHTGALSEVIVTLPREVPPRGTVELDVGYEGLIPLDVTRLMPIGVPEDKARHTDWDQISKSFTAVRGIGYVLWYPVATESANLSEGNSVFETIGRWKRREIDAEMKIEVTHSGSSSERRLKLFCNGEGGVQGQDSISGADYGVTTECRYQPLGLAVPLVVIGSYNALDRPEINISYLGEHKSGAEDYAIAAELAVPFVTQWFGQPRVKAEVVELADPDATPFEAGSMVLTPLGANDSRRYSLTAVHQLTHSAFASPRPWIYEGLAHFAQAAYRERQNGRQAALDFMSLHRTAIADTEKAVAAEHSQNSAASESLINTNSEEFYRSKAMYVWWMLRDMVGDDALQKALSAYHPDQDKAPAYLQHLIEAQAKRDLEWFFDDWVYRDRGLPDFHVESVYSRQTIHGSYMVTVSVENLGDAGAEVPVTVHTNSGELSKRLEVRGKSKNAIRIEVSSPPQQVVVNDGSVPESDMSNNSFKVETPAR
jgi:hypothetical protein